MTESLWRVMYEAAAENPANHGCPDIDHTDCAVMLRAVADWLVPEEIGDPLDDSETMHHIDARMTIRAKLLAEADRAEAGE